MVDPREILPGMSEAGWKLLEGRALMNHGEGTEDEQAHAEGLAMFEEGAEASVREYIEPVFMKLFPGEKPPEDTEELYLRTREELNKSP